MKSFTLTTRRAVAGACALLALGLAGAAQAAWPDKPVTLVVPYSAGGPPTWWRACWPCPWAIRSGRQ